MISRREFIAKGVGLVGVAGLASALSSCETPRTITGTLSGPNATLGHKLRQGKFDAPKTSTLHDVVIIGGGISGLAAARMLGKSGTNFILLELEKSVGGNSSYGTNSVSSYPFGAHYLTVPSDKDPELLRFLEECQVITGYQDGKPIFNDYYLCFDPKERLYIHNQWQDGLVPHHGVPSSDLQEIKRFHELMDYYKSLVGADSKEAFCIPLSFCSVDPEILKLDKLSFGQFISNQGLKSAYLIWYLNYCCADDFGASITNTSAWAGIHYFACHKGNATNAPSDSVLTWPEGNGWLMNQLKKDVTKNITTNCLVYSVALKGDKVEVNYFDDNEGIAKQIIAKKVIISTPQFINQRILSSEIDRNLNYKAFEYAPWMVANLTVSGNLSNGRGEQLSWDNVIYGSSALGYVNANHQNISLLSDKRVLTYYKPLTGDNIGAERLITFSQTYQQWYNSIVKDLKVAHPDLEKHVENLDVWTWGHGMIRPSVGFINSPEIYQARKNIKDKIYFAHSDLSGISIFEEAFFHGTQVAKQVLV